MTSLAGTTSIDRPLTECRASSRLQFRRLADQQNAHPKFARRQDRAFDLGPRGVVASHGVHSDGDHCSLLAGQPARTREATMYESSHGTLSRNGQPAEVFITSRPL